MSDTPVGLAEALRDRYVLERELGRGGMATVYLARDLRHERPVALKVMHPELTATVGPERFLREIQIAATLNHPHILPLHDSGSASGSLYYVMPYVEGESLRDRLARDRQLPLEDTLRIGREVAEALDYAHRHGVVHRDIKPENILLQEGQAVVADFGIAHAISGSADAHLTGAGLTLGTPAYMSPEQAAGETGLDGRTDIYSLGCVLYEMLSGGPPFTGPTPQAIIARRLHDPVPSLRVVRETVPEGVERTIAKALAKVPADRFATAAEFAQALSRGPRAREDADRRTTWRQWIAGAAAALVAAAGVVLLRSGFEGPALDVNLIVVAPFDVLAPSLQSWSEGVMDVLSRSLDGAGPLRTVAPTVTLRRWSGRADPASAAALSRRTGAGLVVFGALDRSGTDSVRIRAEILDVAAKALPLEVEVTGDTLRMDQLIDSLAFALLRELGRSRPVGAIRASPLLGARSLPALKEFLQGEQLYRRNLWDSALPHYDRAIALDSMFALPYFRVSYVLGWAPATATRYNPEDYLVRAALLNHGLAPRDSMIILGNSLFIAVNDSVEPHYFANARRLFATLEEVSRRYPGDPEVWYWLGETRHHFDNPAVATQEEALGAFEHAIALDSGFAPAYFHLPGLAMEVDLGNSDRARRYLATYLRLNPRDDNTIQPRLVARLLDSSQADLPETARLLDAAPAGALFSAGYEHLAGWPDSAESAVRLFRSLARHHPRFTNGSLSDSLLPRRLLAFALMQRGHLREAYQLYPVFDPNYPGSFQNPYVWLALYGAVPADQAAAVFRRALEKDLTEYVQGYGGVLLWWFAHGDANSLSRFASQADSMARRDSAHPVANAVRHYRADAARGYLTLLSGDSVRALATFSALPDSVCGLIRCQFQKLTEARLLEAVGQDRRAAALLDRWAGLEPLAVLERARVGERLGDREKAIKSYQFVTDVWHYADPELQPYVTEARRGLERLTREPRENR